MGLAHLEQPISLASLLCCMNSCREASLLGGEGPDTLCGWTVDAIWLLNEDASEPCEQLMPDAGESLEDLDCPCATWKMLWVTRTAVGECHQPLPL